MKNKIKFLVVLSVITFYSCKHYSQENLDQIQTINFKSASLNTTIKNMVQKGIILDKTDKYSGYPYLLSTDSTNMELSIRFNPDDFEVNTLRQLRIYLEGDTVYNPDPEYRIGMGPISKQKVDHIFQNYLRWYGQYDTIIYPYEQHKLPEDIQKHLEELWSYRDRNLTDEEKESRRQNQIKTYVWYEKDFDVELFLPEYQNNECTGSVPSYDGASITYSVKNYHEVLKKIQDSIRNTLKPMEVVELNLDEPQWEEEQYSTKFSYRIKGIHLTPLASKVNFGEIKAVKFDIVIKDTFDEEIARFDDAIFELPTPIGKAESGYSYYNVGGALRYGNEFEKASIFNKAKNFAEIHTLKLVAEIKAIVLTNGIVL